MKKPFELIGKKDCGDVRKKVRLRIFCQRIISTQQNVFGNNV
jgi:hypothetical protein